MNISLKLQPMVLRILLIFCKILNQGLSSVKWKIVTYAKKIDKFYFDQNNMPNRTMSILQVHRSSTKTTESFSQTLLSK